MHVIKGYAKMRMARDSDRYELIGAGNNSIIGGGEVGTYLDRIHALVTNNLASAITIQDGADDAMTVLPDGLPAGNNVYHIDLGMSCRNNNWLVTCGNGVTAIVSGSW